MNSIGNGNFNSHAHVERDWWWQPQRKQRRRFQLTRSRGAWPAVITRLYPLGAISTHTLTWSVTADRGKITPEQYISTHTLTWSVTVTYQRTQTAVKISTHTLTWSVTNLDTGAFKCFRFQLTRSRGAWHQHLIGTDLYLAFQLTRSRGAWPPCKIRAIRRCYFNSHAHVERDDRMLERRRQLGNFNSHAHVERDGNIGV